MPSRHDRARLDAAIVRAARAIGGPWRALGEALRRALGGSERPPTPRQLAQARALTERTLVALYGTSPLDAFAPDGRAQVGVARALALGVREGAAIPLRDAERTLRAALRTRPDILRALAGNPAPLPVDTARTWVDPHGYRLADRIWQSGARARSRIDGVLEAGIARGASARAIAAELVPLTRPGSPSAVADTLRLARTEIARAYGQAQVAAALRNPFVLALRWTLAEGTHPRTDTCDALAGRYPVDAVPPFPGHPNCRCTLEPELTEATQAMIGRLDRWAQGRGPLPRASLSDIDAAALVDAIADMY